MHNHRMTLNRARHVQRAADSEIFADVPNAMDTRRIRELSRLLVNDDRIILPTVSEGFGRIQKLGGTFISSCMFDIAILSKIECFLVHSRGHHIPVRTPVAEIVERGKRSRQIVRLTVGT